MDTLTFLMQYAPNGDVALALARCWPQSHQLHERLWLLVEFTRVQFVARVLRRMINGLTSEQQAWFDRFEQWSGTQDSMPQPICANGLCVDLMYYLCNTIPRGDAHGSAILIGMQLGLNAVMADPAWRISQSQEQVSERIHLISPLVSEQMRERVDPSEFVPAILKEHWLCVKG